MIDYLDYYRWHEADMVAEEEKLPVCTECDKRIMDDYLYDIGNGPVCEDCMRDNYRKAVDLWIENHR